MMEIQPTLLIGVGGTGCDIANRVYTMAKAGDVLTTNRIAILGFDTDENDIQRRRGTMSDRQLIRTSTPATVFQLLYKHQDQLRDWFAEDGDLTTEIRQMNLTDGAGQVRMLSRLAFQTALQEPTIRADIENALSRLATHDNQNQIKATVNVFLVGSLAGGTGSGMFIQTALVIDRKLRERGFNPQIRALFLLPDIFINAARLPVGQHQNVLANGYAALRELNAIQLKTAGRNPLPLTFNYMPGQSLQADALPFTSVVLMDYENTDSGNLGFNFDAYKQMASRAAYTLLFTPIGGSARSIGANDIRSRLGAAAQNTLNCYVGIGVGSVEYPYEKMLDYLALQMGLALLDGDWLKLDQLYSQELVIYQQRLANGETGLAPPLRSDSYIRNLQLQAKERVRFFREIHQAVEQPTPVGANSAASSGTSPQNPARREANLPQYTLYLNELETQLKARFWESHERLKELHTQQSLNYEALSERDVLMADVSTFEQTRRDFREVVNTALEEMPFSLFSSLVLGGDTRGPNEWATHHLQTYLMKDNPHPVQVRYFLYQVLTNLRKRVAALEDKTRYQALDKLDMTQLFDNPDTADYIEDAIDRASQLAESKWPAWLDRNFKQFVGDYREYFNRYVQTLRKYAEDSLLRRVYEKLELHLCAFLDVLERFFTSLDELRTDLKAESNQAEHEHQPGSGVTDGTLYVFASRDAKRKLWEELRGELAGNSGNDKSNATLTKALHERFQVEQKADYWTRAEPFSGKALFRQAMIEGFCRELLIEQKRDKYHLNVIQAIEKEAKMAGESRDERLIRIIDLVCAQSKPYLSFNPVHQGVNGQMILFWAVSKAVKNAIGDDSLFQGMFMRQSGAQPLVEDGFPDHRLLCLNTCVNLTLEELRKLHPGDRNQQNVGAPQQGSYDQAYRAMLQRMLEDKRKDPNQVARDFTPHLDRTWHKPGVLPEIVPSFDEVHTERWRKAYVFGVVLNLLRWEESYGKPVTIFYDPTRQGTPEARRTVLEAQDDLQLLERLRVTPELIAALDEAAVEAWGSGLDAQGQPATEPEQTRIYQGLRSAETLARILRLSTNRTPTARADEKTSQMVEMLFRQFREFINANKTALAPQEQFAFVAEELKKQVNEALGSLSQSPKPPSVETLKTMRELAEGTCQRLLTQWRV